MRTGSDLGGCAAAAFISVSAVTLLGQSPSLAPLDSPLYTRGPLMVRYMAEMLAFTVRADTPRVLVPLRFTVHVVRPYGWSYCMPCAYRAG